MHSTGRGKPSAKNLWAAFYPSKQETCSSKTRVSSKPTMLSKPSGFKRQNLIPQLSFPSMYYWLVYSHKRKKKKYKEKKSCRWPNCMIINYCFTSKKQKMRTSVFCENTSGFQLKKAKKQPRQLQLCVLCNHQRKGLKSRNYHSKELLSSSNNIFTMQTSTGLLNCHRVSKLPLLDHKLGD